VRRATEIGVRTDRRKKGYTPTTLVVKVTPHFGQRIWVELIRSNFRWRNFEPQPRVD
jgi:hypothetical protein